MKDFCLLVLACLPFGLMALAGLLKEHPACMPDQRQEFEDSKNSDWPVKLRKKQ
jgi:hypothetical protein